MTKLQPGRYQHYKGPFYEVIGTCHHSETLEELVVYRSLYNCERYGDQALWVRPIKMFTEEILHDGKMVPRFRRVIKV